MLEDGNESSDRDRREKVFQIDVDDEPLTNMRFGVRRNGFLADKSMHRRLWAVDIEKFCRDNPLKRSELFRGRFYFSRLARGLLNLEFAVEVSYLPNVEQPS